MGRKIKKIDNSFIGNYNIILENTDTFDRRQWLILALVGDIFLGLLLYQGSRDIFLSHIF